MKLCFLSCGRSDYSIYRPLLQRMTFFEDISITIIAFGSHPYDLYGRTVEDIYNDGFGEIIEISHLVNTNTQYANTQSMGNAIKMLAKIWKSKCFDFVIALGDRYEMFAAVASTLPFNLKLVHIHGGEKTLGAIDNSFRHSITCMSKIHFVSSENHKERVLELLDTEFKNNVYNIGSLAIENIRDIKLYSDEEMFLKYNIDVSKPFALITVHPETVKPVNNSQNTKILINVLKKYNFQKIFTLPNNDFDSNKIRKLILEYEKVHEDVICFEALGQVGYYSFLKKCQFLIGNSSSSIIEAASFGKMAINIGNRQNGRMQSGNIINVPFHEEQIKNSVDTVIKKNTFYGKNKYYKKNSSIKFIEILRTYI